MVSQKQKFLLMGKSAAGKTSMRSIVFANYVPRDTERLGPTIDVERSQIRFLGDLVMVLWDCGGQESFMDNFLDAQRDNVFDGVAAMIYVFDVQSKDDKKDWNYFKQCVESITAKSPGARIFCLIHKMDLIPEPRRESTFWERQEIIQSAGFALSVECFPTSIFDESLYLAWSRIVSTLVPNADGISKRLHDFCSACEADEVVLFERATFLVIAHATLKPHDDAHRFEKISNIIKQFKLSCNKSRAQFESLQLQSSSLTALIDGFTHYTCLMLISSDPAIQPATTWINVEKARNSFENILQSGLKPE